MARTKTDTVEYFPHIAKQGKTLFILEGQFGNDGYATWFKLLELLASTEGHVYDASDMGNWQYLVARMRTSEQTVTEILALLANLGNIDPEMWFTEKIIWCQAFVDNIADVYTKRKRPLPEKPKTNNCYRNIDNCDRNTIIPDISESEIPQSKVNKSKVNKIKEKKETPLPNDFIITDRNRELLAQDGFTEIDGYLGWFKDWAISKNKKYVDWDAAFRNCVRGDWGNLRGNGKVQPQKENTNCTNHPKIPGAATMSGRWYCRSCLDAINKPPEKFELTVKGLTNKLAM